MTIDNNISLKPSPSECNLNARQNEYFDNLTKDIELLKLMLAEIKEKVDGRDTLINTGTINADTVNAGTSVATKDVYANGDLRVQGKANLNDVYIENSLVLGDLAKFTAKLIDVAQLLVNKADIEEADIKSAIIDTLKLKVELQRYDNNQNIVSFPSETVTQLGDIANNIVLAGFDRPKWNDETIAIDSDIANKYYNKTEINNLMDEELIDDLHRETDIIKGNTPVQKVAAGCVDTEGNILATADDAFMLYGSQGRDNIPRNSSLNDLVICGQYNAWKDEVANTINDKPDGESGPFDLTVGYSLADRTMPYQMYTGIVKKTMYIRFYNAEIDSFDTWQQFQFLGGSTSRPLDVGNDEISLKPEYGNELNIYGNNTSKELVIGAKGNKKDVYKFGENASSEIQAKKFTENGKDVAVIDDFLTNAFALNNIPLKANDDIDNLPLGTYATVDFSIFSQIKGNKPFNSPFKIFVFKGGKETDTSSQQLAIDWSSEQIAIRHTDGTSWTAWVQLAMLDSNGYVEKAKNTDNANQLITQENEISSFDLPNSFGNKVVKYSSSATANPPTTSANGEAISITKGGSEQAVIAFDNTKNTMYFKTQFGDWKVWQQVATLDADGYVEKSNTAKNLESGAKVDGALVVNENWKPVNLGTNANINGIAIPDINETILAPGGVNNIENNSDLNNFNTPGYYDCWNYYVKNLINAPKDFSAPENFNFRLIVFNYIENPYKTKLQLLLGTNFMYYRAFLGGKWQDEWKKVATTDYTLNAINGNQEYMRAFQLNDDINTFNTLDKTGIWYSSGDITANSIQNRPPLFNVYDFLLMVFMSHGYTVHIAIEEHNRPMKIAFRNKRANADWSSWQYVQTTVPQTLQTYNQGITKEV